MLKADEADAGWKADFEAFYAGRGIKKIGRRAHAYFAAYSGKELAGHSVIYREKGRWIMDGLLVRPEFRELGIAKRLTEARLRYAASRGAREVWYSCEDGNLVTTCCHLRYGFVKTSAPEPARGAPGGAGWYRLEITSGLFEKFPSVKP